MGGARKYYPALSRIKISQQPEFAEIANDTWHA